MGNMGPSHKHGGKKRISTNGRRRRRNNDVLDWFSDRYRKPTPAAKKITQVWLAKSFAMSNANLIPLVGGEELKTIAVEMMEVASAIGGVHGCKITLSEPREGDPYYESDMEMIIDGMRHDVVISSLDLNELLTSSVGWINRRGIK
jgi:hypothetical protein